MVKVFISYRRSDSQFLTDRIYDRLIRDFGVGRVFRDVNSISPGADYRRALEDAVGQCEVLLAIIGPTWVGAANERGRRLDDETDYVRREIAWGLERNLRVIPLLVGGASMPKASELPPDLEGLVNRQAASVGSGPDFDRGMEVLIGKLNDSFDDVYAPPSSSSVGGEGFFVRLVGSLFPRAHLRLVERGWVGQPREMTVVHGYLEFVAGEMKRLNQVIQYVPLEGAEAPALPPPEAVYATQPTRSEVLKSIRRTVRLISGLSGGGDQATAQLASLNRRSRVVRDVAQLLRRRSEPVILLGDPGSGKSTTIREVGRSIALSGLKSARPPVVIFVPLGRYKSARGDQPGTVWLLINRQVIEQRQHALLDLLPFLERAGRLVVLFDGMDEMERRLYGSRVALLSDFARRHQGRIKTLFACRTNDFNPKFIHRQLVLLEFDRRQVETYLRTNLRPLPLRIGGEVFGAGRLARRLLGDSEWSETARNPLTLYLLCNFLRSQGEWPHTRHELFEHYLRTLFSSLRDANDDPPPEGDWPSARDGWARIAFHITIRHAGTSIALDDLRRAWGEEAANALSETGLRCGLLVPDEADEQTVRFAHHRLQEYLTACFLDRYGTEHAELDWQSLVDTPRWQEVLINLASIQQERSAALKVVLESMQSVIDAPGRARDTLSGRTARWHWPVAEENTSADRVVLASRVIRELGENPAKLPPRFLETFTRSVARLAEEGRPPTQVKMLWAWGNAANVCPIEVLEAALQSEYDWVRGQALSVVGGLSLARTRVGVDLRRELVVDVTNGRLLPRLKAYREAINRAGDRSLYADLAWAVACELVYVAGLLGLLALVYLAALALWPATHRVEPLLPGLGRGAQALTLAAVSASAALLAQRRARVGFWRLATYAGAAGCSVLYLLERLGAIRRDESTLWAFVEAAMRGGIALGLLTFGGLLVFWLKFGLHLLPSLLREDPGRRQTALRIARKNSFSEAERLNTKIFLWSAAALTTVWLLRLAYRVLDTYVLQPVWAFADGLFGSSPWPNRLVGALFVLLVLYRLRRVPGRWAAKAAGWWEELGLSAGGSWREARGLLAAKLGASLRAAAAATPHAALGVLVGALQAIGAILGLLLLLVLFVGLMSGLEWLGVDTGSSQFKPFLILLVVLSLLPFGLFKLLGPVLRPLRSRLTDRLRLPTLWRTTPEKWSRRVSDAEPDEQFQLLSQTHYQTLGVEPAEFLRVLEELEGRVVSEPAASQYWKIRHSLEEISRQERLPTSAAATRHEASAAAQAPPDAVAGDDAGTYADGVATTRVKDSAAAPSRRLRTLRWVLSTLLLAVITGFFLNLYIKRHRVVYVVNGLAEQVEVRIDGGEPFRMGPKTFERRIVAEGAHVITYRAGQEAARSDEFTLTAEWFHHRFMDDRIYVANLGGAAILRYSFGFQSDGDVLVPVEPIYRAGQTFVSFPRADLLFTAARLSVGSGYTTADALEFSPDLPAHVFEQLPTTYSDAQKLALAEEHLRKMPGNVRLLGALEEFTSRRGFEQHFREFLSSEIRRRQLPVEWYARWQDSTLLAEGREAEARVGHTLDTLLGDTPQGKSARLYLQARRQTTLGAKLSYYDEAIRADTRNRHAWLGKCDALKKRGEYGPAREACFEASELYASEGEDGALALADSVRLGWVTHAWRLRWDEFRETAATELIDLDFALRDYEAAAAHLEGLSGEFRNGYLIHMYHMALEVTVGRPELARERHAKFVEDLGDAGAASAAFLHYQLREFDEQVRAARQYPEPQYSAVVQAYAQLELGNYAEVERLAQPLSPDLRGHFALLTSVGLHPAQERQPNRFWRKAQEEFRQLKPPEYQNVAELLSADTPPDVSRIIDTNLSPEDKALILLALAQRFPELRHDALAAFDTFAYTPFPPGHFLRRMAQAASR